MAQAQAQPVGQAAPGAKKTPAAAKAAGQPIAPTAGHTWADFGIVTVVMAALVGLVVFLVDRYYAAPKTTEAILGIVIPALAAAFGVTVGYAGGAVKGQATGKQQGKNEIKQTLLPQIQQMQDVGGAAIRQLRESAHLESPAGTANFVIDPAKGPVEVHPQALNLDDQLASLRSQLEAM